MKVITREVTLYQFHELSDKAKDHAIAKYFSDYYQGEEALESYKALCRAFSAELLDYEMDYECPARSTVRLRAGGWSAEDIASTLQANPAGEYALTGYFMDEPCLDAMREGLEGGEDDLEALLKMSWEALCYAVSSDYDYQRSSEQVSELCEANDYWFTGAGEID